ncbi:hybrid sensor histidine kinase/response regulator transcription factor [Nibrella viscosa]|uniref:histidine kinase n=1 Tax=Nibrella viscosa TaxID=1084524 RepID=A0ABP8KKF8_9BACT
MLAQAQPGGSPYAVSVQRYGVEQGLAHREVNAILQDRQGFMWFATKGGLSRFDGKTFTTYNQERNGFAFDDIQFMAQDADGKLWLMGMQKPPWEVMIFDPQTERATTFQQQFGQRLPVQQWSKSLQVVASPQGTIFLSGGETPAVLLSYHPRTGLRRVVLPRANTLSVVHATNHNTVWAIVDDHLMAELTPDGQVRRQYDHPDILLSSTMGCSNPTTPFFYVEKPGSPPFPFRAIYSIDEQGNRHQYANELLGDATQYRVPIPIYLESTGLIWENARLIDPRKGVVLDLAKQGYTRIGGRGAIYTDRAGQIWLANHYGVSQVKLAPSRFRRLFYNPGDSEETPAIRGIRVIGNHLYVNKEGKGLYKADKSGKQVDPIYTRPNYAAMYALAQDRQGRLYAGANGHLLRADSAGSRSSVRLSPVDNQYNLWTLYAYSDTHLLGGCERGLRLIDAGTGRLSVFTHYNAFPELAEAHVLHIAPDRQGTLWVCANTGLYTVDPRRGITARYWSGGKGPYHLPADNIQHVYQDPNGLYWLATANRGLVCWDRAGGQSRTIRRADGLSNDNIYAVYADRRGDLWLSSDYGIMRFDPRSQTTRTYLVEEGITNVEFNRIAHFQDIDGRIYFGGLNGITSFDPRDFENEKQPERPPLYLTAFRQLDPAQGKMVDKTAEVQQSGRIRIPPGDAVSVLEVAFLNFDDANRNVYAYQVVGLDEGWVTQPEPTLRLTKLPYGDYQLQVRAQAANGQWSANTLQFALTVARPFYLRTWFLMLLGTLAVAGVWGWARRRNWVYRQEQQRLQTQIRLATARIEQDKQTIARQAEALQELDQAKSRFFANISHEFRTPLTVILGMAGELKGEVPPQRLGQVAELIESNGRNLLRLINQILDLSKLEAGEMGLKLERTDLVPFTAYVVESFHSLARQKGISLQTVLEPVTYEADIDKDKLQDVLANLLTNAVKFTPKGGQVTCQVRVEPDRNALLPAGYHQELTPATHLDGPWLQLRVSDSGPGIPPAGLPRIFDRFYRQSDHPGENQATVQAEGTGIGLAFVRELVSLMHGGLAVWSRPGEGSVFVVSLPLLRTDGQAGVSAGPEVFLNNVPAHTRQNPERLVVSPDRNAWIETVTEEVDDRPLLLLVEDNDDVAAYIQTCVQADYQVMHAGNGQAGIDAALEHIPDLIVSDVMMPVKDGFALCDTLKNDERTSHIPIVLLTARAAVGDRIAGLRRGADHYLVKPFQREELLVVLSNLLQTRRLLQLYYSQVALAPALSAARQPADTNPMELAGEQTENFFIRRLRSTLDVRLGDSELTVEEICQTMGMSRSGLHGKLRALTGMSLSRYLRTLRLRRAQDLLSRTALTVSEVAYAVGFEDPKYFSRVFLEEYGETPGSFRQKNENRT